MIDIKYLQIGNKVMCGGKIKEVVTIYPEESVSLLGKFESIIFTAKSNDIDPIEVTEEILNKIGFKEDTEPFIKSYYKGKVFEYRKVINNCFIKIQSGMSNSNDRDWYCHIDNNAHQTIGGFDFQYLHELQNGIRLITKSDLEIKEL